jgi:glutathione synthase/RimK-type ligase-like ATP-grasp enzyme
MKYLIIDKRQRVETKGTHSFVLTRLSEEVVALGHEVEIGYFDDNQMRFNENGSEIKVNGKELSEFTHVMLRGHRLDIPIQYETKRMIIDYIEKYNLQNPDKKILVQNGEAIKNFPYYDKLYMSMICTQSGIPIIDTYYRLDGKYSVNQIPIATPLIAKNYVGQVELRNIDGKDKIKKNVFRIEKEEDFQQENLSNKNLEEYFVQEFLPTGEDVRVFVKKGKVIAAFKRVATEGFMTVVRGEYTIFDLVSNPETVQAAERAAEVFKADFMAVDFMYKNGKPLLQEISFAPGFKAFEIKIEGNTMNMAKEIVTAF